MGECRTLLLASLAIAGCTPAIGPRPAITPVAAKGPAREAREAREPAPPATRVVVVETAPSLEAPASSRCPPEMVLVDGRVCVDRYEASLERVEPGGRTSRWSPHSEPGRARVRAVSIEGELPQGHVSGIAAARACRAAGKRLCTDDEWLAACGGPERSPFPYGENRREGACNDDGRARHPVAEVTQRHGLDPDRMWYENMHHAAINQLPDTVEPTGAHERCRSEYGAADMVGNLHEWVDDPEGTFRGGFFMDTRVNGEGCSYATTAHGKDYRDYSTGFRCCRDPEPLE